MSITSIDLNAPRDALITQVPLKDEISPEEQLDGV
jgi:hypothetical protein